MADVVKVQVVADTSTAKQQLQDLQSQLQSIAAKPVDINSDSLVKANQMAVELQQNLQKAMNPNTGKLDLSVFSAELAKQKRSLNDYATALKNVGPEGQQAFLTLSRTIAMAEAPTTRLNASLMKFGQTIKNTINWQISSSLIHGVVGQVQSAINYAEKLNTSLTNIRIVTNQNNDQMAKFAKQANEAAHRLNTTTTAYTNASLIYYQQGLGDKEVAERTETTLKLANVSKQSVETVSSQLTAIWNNYAEGSGNLEHYADVITALGAATASSSQEIATGLQKFAAVGKTVGLSYDYATTALATVTATTRQSADTVGTGLRTLFSRLQGLKLGDTLEDGVNLNKYSAALATVGVNIQDQYGKVKDMDQILDELGSKWQNISKEQQIALAQTVGGVRQYTNLIALMDNWDKFQQNLTVAQGADGTLQRQADIYGESWEAASKRVRASIESIYSSLIDDQVVIKLIDGFAGFMDIIHGITEGLGGMKGVLLTVSSIFMSQYAKNIPQVLTSLTSGFKSFFGIGMVKTQYGKMDKDTWNAQRDNEALLAATARDTSLSNADRIAAQGSLALSRMNAAYQGQRKFLTADQQAAEELKLKNAEASYNSLEAQARANEKIDQTSERELAGALKKAAQIHRTGIEQAALEQARDEAENEQMRAEREAAASRAGAKGMAKRAAKAAQHQLDMERQSGEDYDVNPEYDAAKKQAAQLAENAKKADQTAQAKEDAAKIAKQNADAAKQAARTPEEIIAERDRKAQQLWEKQDHKNAAGEQEEYITAEAAKGNAKLAMRREAQQNGLLDTVRDLYGKEALYADTVDTAKAGLGRFKNDKTALAAALADTTLSEKNKTQIQDDYLKSAKDKGIKYRDNLKAAINEKYDKTTAEALNAKIDEAGKGIDEAKSLDDVEGIASKIAGAIETALKDGIGEIKKESDRGEEMTKANQAAAEATGLEESYIEGFGQDHMEGKKGEFAAANTLQELQNPPESKKPKPLAETDPFSATVAGLGQVTAAAAAFTGGLSAVSNAFNLLQDESASFATKLGAVGGALGSLKNVGDVTQNAAESIGQMIGKAAPGWIGAAVSVATMAFGLIKGHFDKLKQEEQERRQEIMNDADAKNEELKTHKDLIDNNYKLIESYNDLKKAGASNVELAQQQSKILEESQEVGQTYNITGLASSIMGGKMNQAQALIDQARLKELTEGRAKNEAAQNVAGKNLQDVKRKGIITNQDEQTYETLGYTISYGMAKYDEKEAYDILNKYDSLKNGELSKDAFKDAESSLATYNNLVAAYEEMKTTMTADQQSDSEVFKNTKKLIDSMSEQAETYKKYKDQITDYGIETIALGGQINDASGGITTNIGNARQEITDLETYEKYRANLIQQTANARGITDESSQEYKDLVTSVDAYLGTLTNVTSNEKGNLQQISKGLNDIVDSQAALEGKSDNQKRKDEIKASLKNLYDQYGDAIFELDSQTALNIPANLDTEDLSGRLKTQLELLQAIADANTIKAQIELVNGFDLTDKSSFEQWGSFAKSLNANQKTAAGEEIPDSGMWESIFGEKFDIAKFTSLSSDEQQRQLHQYTAKLNKQYYGPGGEFEEVQAKREADATQAEKDYNDTVAKRDAKLATSVGNSQMALSAQKIADNADLFRTYNELTQLQSEGKLDAAGQKQLAETKASITKNTGISESAIDSFSSFTNEVLATIDAVDAAEASMTRANEAVETGRAEQEAYKKTGFRQALIDEADQWDINYDSVKTYASQLREAGVFTEDEIEASERYALSVLKQNAAIENIKNNYSDWLKILNDDSIDKNSTKYQDAFDDMEDSLRQLFGLTKKDPISPSLMDWAKKTGNLKKLIEGNTEAWGEAFAEQVKGFVKSGKLTDELSGKIDDFTQRMAKKKKGELISQDEVKEAQDIVKQIAAARKAAGEEMSETEQVDLFKQLTNTEGNISMDANGNFVKTITLDIAEGEDVGEAVANALADVPEGTDVHIGYEVDPPPGLTEKVTGQGDFTVSDVPITGVGAVAGADGAFQGGSGQVTVTVPVMESKGTGGNNGGGGGGGGGKKEPHKIKRYRNIENQIQNNKRQTDAVSRKKDRSFGTAKLDALKEERQLREENLKLEQQYQKEIEDWLDKDKKDMMEAFKAINFTPIFDEAGEVINNDEFEKAFEAIGDGSNEAWKKAEEALAQYEETLDKYNDKLEEIKKLQEEIFDSFLEQTKLEIELKVNVSDDRLEYLDYLLGKIEADANSAADAIDLLGDKTRETMTQAAAYQAGIEDILSRHKLADGTQLTIDNIGSMSADELKAAGFTQDEIDQLKEWRSALLEANQTLLEMRTTIVDKVLSVLDDFNEKIQRSYDKFDTYNSILENYKNINELIGTQLSSQSKDIANRLNQSMLANARNQTKAAKNIYDQALNRWNELNDPEGEFQQMLKDADEETLREYQRILDQAEDNLNEAQQQWLDSWQSTLELAKTIFETAMEDMANTYSKSMSGMFGSLDYLQAAYDRQKETNEQYLQDFDKLYELSKLSRDISKAIDDTDNIKGKQKLRDLQAQINKLQADGSKLSEYQVQALQKQFELEQARLAIDEAKNAKSQVRLQRDAEGNWGYVYTADEDKVAEAEQAYEDKLHEYQVLNHEYIQKLQDEALSVQQQWQETVGEIYADLSLGNITQEEADARLNEINEWLAKQQGYFQEQSNIVLGNQASLYQRTLDTYNVSSASIVDTWEETNLAMLTNMNSLDGYMSNWTTTVDTYLNDMLKKYKEYKETLDGINGDAGVSTDMFSTHIENMTVNIGEHSDQTVEDIENLSELLSTTFSDALAETVKWEQEYAETMADMIAQNEEFITSLNEMIELLSGLDGAEFYARVNRTAGAANAESYDTGGYTGTWGSSGKLAFLHEKENVFNADDTQKLLDAAQLLRTLDIQTSLFSRGLGSFINPRIFEHLNTSALEQDVHIVAEFPNVTDHNEIEEAFTNLVNKASQYANRKGL